MRLAHILLVALCLIMTGPSRVVTLKTTDARHFRSPMRMSKSKSSKGKSKRSSKKTGSTRRSFRNVIILIPDGCDDAVQTLARWYRGTPLALDQLPRSSVTNHMANSVITGSAAAATAFASGHKTTVDFVGVGPRTEDLLSIYANDTTTLASPYAPVASILEAAQLNGKLVGLVATSTLSHATPAAFAAHVDHRSKENEIMEQLVYHNLDVAFGGGREWLLPTSRCPNAVSSLSTEGKRVDCQNLIEVLQQRGVSVVGSRVALHNVTRPPVWGVFADQQLKPDIDRPHFAPDEPSLSEMTAKAIELLSRNEKRGFLLIVEGSQIDWGAHNNDPIFMLTEFLAFDDAVRVAINFAAQDKKTLVLVYPDHGTGGMAIGNYAHDYKKVTVENLIDPLKGMNMTADAIVMLMSRNPDANEIVDAVQTYWGLPIELSDAEAILEYRNSARQGLNRAIAHVLSEKFTYIGWTTHGHNGETVPAWFYGIDTPDHLLENTDLAWMAADALHVDLNKATKRLFVDVNSTSLDYHVNLSNRSNPVVEISDKAALLPIGKDYLIVKNETVKVPGLTIYAPNTGKVYLSQQAVEILLSA